MEIFILFLLTLLNGFFALSEISFVALRKTAIENLASKGNKRAALVLKLQKNPEMFLSSVQVGITLISIISGAYGSMAFADEAESLFASIPFLAPYKHDLALILVIGSITYFSILLGELIPKSIGMNHAESLALICVPVIYYFIFITYPFVKLLSVSTALLLKISGVKEKEDSGTSEEELRFILKTAGARGVLMKEQSDVHENLFYFSDQVAVNLMTSRNRIEWIDTKESYDEVLKKIRKIGFSKFPLCDGSLDKLVGIVSVRDFMEHYQRPGFEWKSIVKAPVFLAATTPAFNILGEFRKQKLYVGFVVDEFGRIEGIVTLKDLMESIIGDLPDEDTDDSGIIKREDGSWLVNGTVRITELNRFLQTHIIEDKEIAYSTVAGFFLFRLKRFPHTGDTLLHNGYSFEVVDIDSNRIDKLLIKAMS